MNVEPTKLATVHCISHWKIFSHFSRIKYLFSLIYSSISFYFFPLQIKEFLIGVIQSATTIKVLWTLLLNNTCTSKTSWLIKHNFRKFNCSYTCFHEYRNLRSYQSTFTFFMHSSRASKKIHGIHLWNKKMR